MQCPTQKRVKTLRSWCLRDAFWQREVLFNSRASDSLHRVSSILITYWHLISHSRIMPAQQHLVTSWRRAVQTFMKMSLQQFDYTTGRGRRWNLQHDLTSLLHHATSNPPPALSSYRLTAVQPATAARIGPYSLILLYIRFLIRKSQQAI